MGIVDVDDLKAGMVLASELVDKNTKLSSFPEIYHHSPLKARSPLEAAIINVANIMAATLRFGDSGNRFASPFEKSVWDTIGLPPSIFTSSIKQADRQVYEILTAFRLDNMNDQ